MKDILGQALLDYTTRASKSKLWIHNRYGEKEEMPMQVYFRNLRNMPELELMALDMCRGSILDIGAAAGCHTLALQQRNANITALDISPKACEVLTRRGVKNVVNADFFSYSSNRFDTLLMLMNGVGFASTIEGLRQFLEHAKTLLMPGGQVIFDSSDVSYLYSDHLPDPGAYYGEIWYQYEYKKQKGDWFKWLYVDQITLRKVAVDANWKMEVVMQDEHDQYLAVLTPGG